MTKQIPWYVVQVAPHKEAKVCELITRVAPAGSIDEAFSPSYETEAKVQGTYQMRQHTFMPGYVVVATDDLPALLLTLSKINEFAQVLRSCDTYAPLEAEEQAWLAALTRKGNRIVPMSTGIFEGDKVVVLDGPLVGLEAKIKKVDRHHSTAYLEFQMCSRTVVTKVGLAIVAKR